MTAPSPRDHVIDGQLCVVRRGHTLVHWLGSCQRHNDTQLLDGTVSFAINKYLYYLLDTNVNVNVNLYSASSQKAPLMCSMCRVLIKKTRLQCTMKTVNLHVRLTQIVLEQVPCRWSNRVRGVCRQKCWGLHPLI